jgi:dehydrogenase/reductase SDR family member 1
LRNDDFRGVGVNLTMVRPGGGRNALLALALAVVALRLPLPVQPFLIGRSTSSSSIRITRGISTTGRVSPATPPPPPPIQLAGSASAGSTRARRSSSSSSNNNNEDIRLDHSETCNNDRGALKGCVCLVTGASRGIGKGIALELGRAGATVYVTGTSTTSSQTNRATSYATSELVGGPGTIEETAQQVTEAGGHGIPVYCNHAVDDDVKQLFQQIQQQHGRLDLLVNNAFRVPGGPETLYGKFWEQGSEVWDCLHTVGLRSHYVASCYAVPLLLESRKYWTSLRQENPSVAPGGLPRPLIVMISSFGGLSYAFNVAYGVAKAGVDRLAKDMAVELHSEGICVVSLWPGVVATERTDVAVQSGDWDKYVGLPLDHCESPEFTGRAVKALALDPHNLKKSGSYQVVAELAEEYRFTDTNGRRPPSIRSLRFLLPTYAMSAEMRAKVPAALIPDWKLPFWVMSQGAPPPPQRQDE